MKYSKFVIFIIIFSIIISSFSLLSSVDARNYILKTESSLTIISGTNDLGIIDPLSSPVQVNITMKYEYGRLARPIGFPFYSKPTYINLSVDMPSWCSVEYDRGYFEAPIETFIRAKNKSVNLSTILSIMITDVHAPAYQEGIIQIKATAEQNGNIRASSATYDIKLQPNFLPIVKTTISNDTINVKSKQETNVSITVENMGNKKITVDVTSDPLNYNYVEIEFPEKKSIEIDEEVSLPIIIKALKTEEKINEIIVFEVNIYEYGVDLPILQQSAILHLSVNIEGEKEGGLSIDYDTLVIIVILIFIIIILLFIVRFYFKRRQR